MYVFSTYILVEFIKILKINKYCNFLWHEIVQSAGAVEYADCVSAEG